MSAHKLDDVESFEFGWVFAKRCLENMAMNPIVTSDGRYPEFMRRLRYLEEFVIETSDLARSDKD